MGLITKEELIKLESELYRLQFEIKELTQIIKGQRFEIRDLKYKLKNRFHWNHIKSQRWLPKQKRLLLKLKEDGLSFSEICRKMQITQAQARSMYHYIK